jgi:hypothetical protein
MRSEDIGRMLAGDALRASGTVLVARDEPHDAGAMSEPQELARFLKACSEHGLLREGALIELPESLLADFLDPLLLYENLPVEGQTAAMTMGSSKVAALFFDRVWAPPATDTPRDIGFYCGTTLEAMPFLLRFILDLSTPEKSAAGMALFSEMLPTERVLTEASPTIKWFTEFMGRERNVRVTPVYDGEDVAFDEYRQGDRAAVVATLEGLQIVDQDRLAWDQVREVRADERARMSIRRFRTWLDKEFDGKPIAFVEDQIALRLDDYEWALRKHGITTITGALTDLLDFKFLPAATAATLGLAFAGGGAWAALAAGGIVAGKVAVSVTQRMVEWQDRKRVAGAEVAFIHELKKLAD